MQREVTNCLAPNFVLCIPDWYPGTMSEIPVNADLSIKIFFNVLINVVQL